MGGGLRAGDRVRVTSETPLYGCFFGDKGTVVLITGTAIQPPLYHVRMDRVPPEELVALYRDEIEPAA